MTPKNFQGRALTTLMVAVTFLVVSLSGLLLFFAPKGRLAREQGWQFLSLTRRDWSEVHTWFGFLCLAVGVCHLWLNRKPFLGYLKKRADNASFVKREVFVAVFLCAAYFIAVLWWET